MKNNNNAHVIIVNPSFWNVFLIKQTGFLKVLWGADDDVNENGKMTFGECYPFGSFKEIKSWAKSMYRGWGYDEIRFYKKKYVAGKHFETLKLSNLKDNKNKMWFKI